MQLKSFLEVYEVDDGFEPIALKASEKINHLDLDTFFSDVGGRSFNLGSIRTLTKESSLTWNKFFGKTFPKFKDIIHCFAYSWDGRFLAIATKEHADIEPGVVIFDPATASTLNATMNLVEFLDDEIAEGDEDFLDFQGFLKWLEVKQQPPAYSECVGYDVPLFLSGKENMKNRSITDLEVYWDITGQLIEKHKILD